MNLEKPRINFNASVGQLEAARILARMNERIILERFMDNAGHTGETHPASKEIKWILDFAHNYVETNLGLDLEHMKPGLGQVLIYSNEEFEVAKKRYNLGSIARAFSKQVGGEIHVNGSENRPEFIHHLIHEYAHLLSHQKMMVRHGSESNGVSRRVKEFTDHQGGVGMNVNEKFLALNEVITEMLACEILRELEASSAKGFGLEVLEPAYKSSLFTLGRFMFELSRREKISFSELRKIFYSAYIEGDMSRLRIITTHFGAKATGEVSDFPVLADESEAINFLRKYGIYTKDTAQRYNDLNVLNLFKMLRA